MKHTTFKSNGEPESQYKIEHNLGAMPVVNIIAERDGEWWAYPCAVHHLDVNTIIIDLFKPMHINVVMFVVE